MTPAEEYVKDHPWLTDALHDEIKLATALYNCFRCDSIIISFEELKDLGITWDGAEDNWMYKNRIIHHGY